MTVSNIKVRSASRAFEVLEGLSKGFNRFRGHRNSNWRLVSTLVRHRTVLPAHTVTFGPADALQISGMIDDFIVNLASIGITTPFEKGDMRGRLEYARHYGVPSPLIDFTFSPYVALFFAFSGVRPLEARSGDNSVVYCVNIFELAGLWANHSCARDLNGRISDGAALAQIHNRFKFDSQQEV